MTSNVQEEKQPRKYLGNKIVTKKENEKSP